MRAASLAAAGLLALDPLAHLLYLGWVPGRPVWWLLWAGSTAALYWPVRRLAGWAYPHLRAAGPAAVAVPVLVGAAAAAWWSGELLDVLWLLGGNGRRVVRPLLEVAHAAAITAPVALAVAALAATDPPPEPAPARRPLPWVAAVLFAVAGGALVVWYVGREQTVYSSDFMYYWCRAADWGETLRADPGGAAAEFRRSVQRDTYTLLPTAPPGAVLAAFGDHRRVYLLAVVGCYLPPLLLAAAAVVRLAAPGRPVALPVALAVGLYPGLWVPLVRGYPDVGGLPLAVGALAVYLGRPPGRLRWHHLFALAGLLAGLVLFRRWYAFWVVAFGAAVAVDGGLAAARAVAARDFAAAVRCLRPAVALGLLLPAALGLAALPVLRDMAGNDYADVLTGYRSDRAIGHRLGWLAYDVGLAYLVPAAVAAAALAAGSGRRPALFVAGMVPVMLAQFTRVQDPNLHHLYLFLPALTLLPAAGLARLPRWAVVPAAAGWLFLLVPVIVPEAGNLRPRLIPVMAYVDGRPFARTDLAEFRRLAGYLNALPAGERYVVLRSASTRAWWPASAGRSGCRSRPPASSPPRTSTGRAGSRRRCSSPTWCWWPTRPSCTCGRPTSRPWCCPPASCSMAQVSRPGSTACPSRSRSTAG